MHKDFDDYFASVGNAGRPVRAIIVKCPKGAPPSSIAAARTQAAEAFPDIPVIVACDGVEVEFVYAVE